MTARGLLSMRHGKTIRIPSRPVIGSIHTTSMTTASVLVTGPGAGGAVTDLTVENREGREIEALLSFTAASGRTSQPTLLLLQPFETREVADVLAGFGEDGTFRIQAVDGSPASLGLIARSYAGQGSLREADSEPRFLAGLAQNEAFDVLVDARADARGNAGGTARPQSFSAILRSADGTLLATRVLDVPASGDARWTLSEIFPEARGDGLSLEITGPAGSPVPEVRASITDLRTGNRIDVPASRACERLYLQAATRTALSGGTSLATDAAILNAGDAPVSVRLRFLERDRDNASAETASLRLGPRESRRVEDVLGAFFGRVEVAGILEIGSDGGALVVAGTETARIVGEPGTVRTPVMPIEARKLARTSVLTSSNGLERVLLFNPGEAPLAAVVRWLAADGTIVSETSVVVPPRGSVTAETGGAGSYDRVIVETGHSHFAFPDQTDTIGRGSGGVPPRSRPAR